MPTITLRDVPKELLDRLKQRAEEDRRSLNQQVIHLVERALQDELLSPTAQAERWLHMRRWRSRRTAQEEIADIYNARTRGR